MITKLRLISKFMTSQAEKQTITIHILHTISKSKSNHTMKFGDLREYKAKKFFFKNHAENEAERLVPDLLLFFK